MRMTNFITAMGKRSRSNNNMWLIFPPETNWNWFHVAWIFIHASGTELEDIFTSKNYFSNSWDNKSVLKSLFPTLKRNSTKFTSYKIPFALDMHCSLCWYLKYLFFRCSSAGAMLKNIINRVDYFSFVKVVVCWFLKQKKKKHTSYQDFFNISEGQDEVYEFLKTIDLLLIYIFIHFFFPK